MEQPLLELPSLRVKSGGGTRNSRCSSRDGEQREASFGYSRFSRSRFPAGDALGDPEAEILPLPAGGLRLPEHPGHRRLRVASLLHQQRSGAAGSVRPSRFSIPGMFCVPWHPSRVPTVMVFRLGWGSERSRPMEGDSMG